MTGLDWAIVGFTVLLGFYGYLQGFIVGAMSLAGFALGAFLGTGWLRWCSTRARTRSMRRCSGWAGRCWSAAVFANVLEFLGSRARLSERCRCCGGSTA